LRVVAEAEMDLGAGAVEQVAIELQHNYL